MSAALVALLTVGGVYLVRTWHPPRPAPVAPAPPRTSQLDYASFGDADHGAATMSRKGAIATFVTADGGRTWSQRSTEPAATTFLDRSHAVMLDLGSNGAFRISANAGRTWATGSQPITFGQVAMLPSHLLGGPVFLDPADGWWLEDRPGTPAYSLWRTTDGGHSWDDLAPSGIPTTDGPPPQLVFADPLRGVLVVPGGRGQWPTLVATLDGGRTWRAVALTWPSIDIAPANATDPSVEVATLVAYRGRIVLSLDVEVGGSQAPLQAIGRSISVSDDGGQTWAPWRATPGTLAIGSAIVFDDAGWLAMADDRHLWTSTDVGRTWHLHPLPVQGGRPASAEVVSAAGGAVFVVTQRGAPDAGTLLRSLDGGASWTEVQLPGD